MTAAKVFRLREMRERAEMSRDELGVLIGWSPSKVARIENGHVAGFLWSDATDIAVALGCTLDELAGIEGERP